ncbi:MAG: FtsK/SpoIIIE family protein [Fibrobacteres bacterium]|nr:FtsK/SpoIIIE family protein [Fibrobacterota bacterium]
MKTIKRKAKKPAPKSRGKAEPEVGDDPSHSLMREGWGLLLLSVSLVTVIALLSGFANPGETNILGPYLGDWWAETLNRFAGGLPVLFLVAAVATLGFKLVLAKGGLRVRLVLALLLLFVSTGVLLSIKNIAKTQFQSVDYQVSGGYLGNFLVQKLFLPVFGTGQFGPYLITAIATLFVLIWGFRMSVVSVSEKSAASIVLVGRPFFLGLRRLWSRPEGEEFEDDEDSRDGSDAGAAAAEIAKARAGAKVERGRPALAKFPLPDPEQPKPEGRRKRGTAPERDESPDDRYATASLQKSPVVSSDNYLGKPNGAQGSEDGAADVDEDIELLDLNDPLAVRKSRDLHLERKRVNELNEWEIKARDPEIAGLLKKAKDRAREEAMDGGAVQAAPAETATDSEDEDSFDSARSKKKGRKKDKPAESLAKIVPAASDYEAPVPLKRKPMEAEDESGEDDADEETSALDSVSGEDTDQAPVPKPPKPEVKYDPYRVPSHDEIFSEPPKQPLEFTEEELREQSKVLEDQLINFKVMGKVTQICPGPVITRYEVELAPGVKVSRISTLADDLALALKAKSIRILAPIPGKSVVGIEVPNRKAQIVYIKEILRAPEFAVEEDTLKICLGKTIAGEPYVMDLTRAPHLLIAGQTGSGKSVCINSIMASFLCSKSPDDLRMILVDPKVVELKPYDAIPHLLYPVITQPDVAVQALKWSTFEMDRRYEVLAQCGVRNIKGFNAKVREGTLPDAMDDVDKKIMPYIVIVIDELADLMMVAGKEVETNIARIAQKARAVGIHLILATQRPSTNVITGTIKANLPTRISFQVASQIDARTIMDKMGAEKLLGRGDMLFRPIEFPEPVRLHGCFLDDNQAEKLALVASEQHVNYPQIQSFNLEDDPSGDGGKDEPRDEKFREAAELVVQVKQASVSLLQRRLGIGYARSGRLVDQLERAGVVGRERGSKPREVLMNPEELQSFLSSGLNDD